MGRAPLPRIGCFLRDGFVCLFFVVMSSPGLRLAVDRELLTVDGPPMASRQLLTVV